MIERVDNLESILTVTIDKVSIKRPSCTCCNKISYVTVTAGTEIETSKQTQRIYLCEEHAKQLKMFLPN